MKMIMVIAIGVLLGSQTFARALPPGYHQADTDYPGGHCAYDYDGKNLTLKYWGPADRPQSCTTVLKQPLPEDKNFISVDVGNCSSDFEFDDDGTLFAQYTVVDGADFYDIVCKNWK